MVSANNNFKLISQDRVYIINARLPNNQYYYSRYELLIENAKIKTIQPQKNDKSYEKPVIDLKEDWISLGGADLQINGALGLPFPDLELNHCEQIGKISKFLWEEGIDLFLPTIITTSPEKIKTALATVDQYIQDYQNRDFPYAKIFGVHLEGPFLNPEKRGAHPQKYLLPFTIDNLVSLIGKYSKYVKVLTCAPEISSDQRIIAELKLRYPDIDISLGHSMATAAEAERAFREGASMVTHAFNAMPSLHHREPGLLGSALTHSGVKCGFIADGQHISPTMLQLLLRMGEGSKRLFLVSDALAPLGLGEGVYPWDDREITVNQGTARLEDGTLAGTTLSLLSGAANLVKWGVCDVGCAIALATESPREAIGEAGLGVGQPVAKLLRWHWDDSTQNLTWKRLVNTMG